MQSKHPHIVYHSDQKPKQLCGVIDTQIHSYDRSKRATEMDIRLRREIGSEANRTARDVRYVTKFIETALVLDKAMVSWRGFLLI